MTARNKFWFIFLAAISLFTWLTIALPERERSFINYLGIIGFVMSILGLLIAYIQIMSLKEMTKTIQQEVQLNLQRQKSVHLISDISGKVVIIGEIQSFIRQDKMELCILRMNDLKRLLIDLKHNNEFTKVARKDFNEAIENHNIDLTNMNRFLLNNKNKLNREDISKNLEVLSEILIGVETKLKTQ